MGENKMPATASQNLKRLRREFDLDYVEIDNFMQYLNKLGKNGFLMSYEELREELEKLFNNRK